MTPAEASGRVGPGQVGPGQVEPGQVEPGQVEPGQVGPGVVGWDVLAVVAIGGAAGCLARYGLTVLWPPPPDGLPWATLVTNLTGCALIGALMQVITTRIAPHRLVRPLLGTGVLGGFTTFSTYAVETRGLLAAGRPALAAGYVFGTLIGALVAVRLGMWVAARARRS